VGAGLLRGASAVGVALIEIALGSWWFSPAGSFVAVLKIVGLAPSLQWWNRCPVSADPTTDPRFAQLADLLRERKSTIADHEFRDRDAAAHLAALQSVSERIMALHLELKSGISAKLDHYLSNCSFDKALDFLEGN